MNVRVLRRFVVLMAILTVVVFLGWDLIDGFIHRAPGDFNTETGSYRLQDGLYDEAMEQFNLALEESPNHRGALMGRALVFIKTERYDQAITELTFLIEFLNENLEPEDGTGRGALAAAYANRGIVRDRLGDYQGALQDYIAALKVDREAVAEPGVVHKILHGNEFVSSVEKRAIYLTEQLALPEDQRVLRIPELDDKQRMYKP